MTNAKTEQRLGGLFGALVISGLWAMPLAAQQDRLTFGLAAVNDPFFGQRENLGFGQNASIWAQLSGSQGAIDYTLRLSVEVTDEEAEFQLDGSQVALRGDLWSVAIGAKERNWSFSPNTSLIWSQNARPVPAVWFERAQAPSRYRWLSWLGEWSGEIVFGLLDAEEPDPNISMFGARLVFNPLPGLDVELVRTAQWGGPGRPNGLDAFWNMLIGNSNQGSLSGEDPANQMAGIGLSYQLPEGVAPMRFYVQAIGEDESSGVPSCEMYLGGVEWDGAIGSTPTTIVIEALDTIIAFTEGGFCGPNTAYRGQYSRGYTHYGAVMGAAVDTAGQALSIDVLHKFEEHSVGWGFTQVVINDTSAPSHRLSSERIDGATAYISYNRDFGPGRLQAGVTYQGFDLDNADQREGFRGFLEYQASF